MILLLVKKNPFSLIPKTTPTLCFSLLHLHHFSSSTLACSDSSPTRNPKPRKPSNFITEYSGLSPQKAATASKRIPATHLTSLENPDSVRHFFFKHLGFTDAQTRSLITNTPRILSSDVENTLQPNLHFLQSIGFSDHQLRKLVVRNPRVLLTPHAIPRLDFWKSFLNGDINHLFLAFTRNLGLIDSDIDKNIVPKISFLRDHGFSEDDIRMIVIRVPNFIKRSITTMEVMLRRAQELGFELGSKMIVCFLLSLTVGIDQFTDKMELFRSFEWSEREFLMALQKSPHLPTLSKENIRKKMDFLVGTAGCTQSYIASHPKLLNFSLQKRLSPRYHILKILRVNKLLENEWDFFYIMDLPEMKFVEKIILPYKAQFPSLHDTYDNACANRIQI